MRCIVRCQKVAIRIQSVSTASRAPVSFELYFIQLFNFIQLLFNSIIFFDGRSILLSNTRCGEFHYLFRTLYNDDNRLLDEISFVKINSVVKFALR